MTTFRGRLQVIKIDLTTVRDALYECRDEVENDKEMASVWDELTAAATDLEDAIFHMEESMRALDKAEEEAAKPDQWAQETMNAKYQRWIVDRENMK